MIGLILAGAIINVAVAWGAIKFQATDWSQIIETQEFDQTQIKRVGIPTFDRLRQDTLTQFGLVDREYSALVDPPTDRRSGWFLYARHTQCGWPMLAVQGARWAGLNLD